MKIAELTATGAAALNANALFRTGLTMAYQAGSTGCAIRALPTGVNTYEFDEWYPSGGDRGGGKATSFTVLDGVASPQPGVNKSDAWRPPDGANCTIHPNGTISVPSSTAVNAALELRLALTPPTSARRPDAEQTDDQDPPAAPEHQTA